MAVVMGVAAIAFGLFWTIGAANMGSRLPGGGLSPLFGVVFILFGLGMAAYQLNKARDFRTARRRYHRARRVASRDGGRSADEFLAELEHIPTPHEYLGSRRKLIYRRIR